MSKQINPLNDYLEINKKGWNLRTPHHVQSDFYNLDAFIQNQSSLNEAEIRLVGDVKGKSLLHLQCHFGMDTLSWARKGAQVTGLDFSDEAINKAIQLAEQLKINANFVCTDVYNAFACLNQQFDIVFTSYGTIGWLPDLNKWAEQVFCCLQPGGKFVIVEFHPVVWMYDPSAKNLQLSYSYFNESPIIEEATGTYTDTNSPIKFTEISWNHPISDVVNALIHNGLRIQALEEYDFSYYNCFAEMEKREDGCFQFKAFKGMPLMYALVATKDNN